MNIVAVDDEKLALSALAMVLREVFEGADIYEYSRGADAVRMTAQLKEEGTPPEYAFLDIRLRGSTGIELARQIKDISPETLVIFVTAYNDYASEAFSVNANGYLLKPVSAEAVRRAVERIDNEIVKRNDMLPYRSAGKLGKPSEHRLNVVTFGKFYPTLDGRELAFERSKSRELLALLVDQRGVGLANAEIEAYLWEDSVGDKRKSGYVQKVILSLMKTLKKAGIDNIIEKRYNYIAIKPDMIDCDLYDFLAGDLGAINSYYGTYMEEYSWAEMTTGMLSSRAGLYD